MKEGRAPARALKDLIQRHGAELSSQLQAHHRNTFPPEAEKVIRHFSPAETARLIGIHEGYLRQITSEGKGFSPATRNGRRSYSVNDIHEIRKQLDQGARGSRRYRPHRVDCEQLQVITVMNFKGGSGKTTTAAHLAQYLALHGYRVLAIDLDPQASLSALFGQQPELDVGPNENSVRGDPIRSREEANCGGRSRDLHPRSSSYSCKFRINGIRARHASSSDETVAG